MKHIVIIGNGISGITTARHIRKLSDYKITVISSETNHFFARTALMYIYMGHMKFEHTKPYEDWFWKKNKINLVNTYIKNIDVARKILYTNRNGEYDYDILIIASGSKPNKFGWPGQDLKGVTGMYSIQDLEEIEKYTKGIERGVIVGGGLIGIELAEMLHSRNIPISLLVRENSFWNNVLPMEESELISREIIDNKIDLQLGVELKEILSDEDGRVKAVITSNNETIECQFVGLTAGVHPNISFIKDSGIDTNVGVLVDSFLKTNIEDVYAIGDCAEFKEALPNRKRIEQVWYTGRMQAETLAQIICGNKMPYKPGIWFNSAKFFNIEYQTYGLVWNELNEDEAQLYWEHSDGKKCLKIVYNKKSKVVLGMNVFGIRLRHEVCEQWIKNAESVDEVINNLCVANFDPEFSTDYIEFIKEKFINEISLA